MAGRRIITSDFIISKDAVYQIDIAGHRFSCTPYLRAPPLINMTVQGVRYKPTVVSYKSDISN